MTKATTSAVDFLAAIGGRTELCEVEGATVELRSLSFAETQTLSAQYGDDNTELALRMVELALVNPPLTVDQLRQVRPGPLAQLAQRVTALSGLEAPAGSPLAGTGS